MEKRIKPEEIKMWMTIKMTGEACSEEERNDTSIYKVVNLNKACKSGAHIIVETEDGTRSEMRIAPWVPVILVADAPTP